MKNAIFFFALSFMGSLFFSCGGGSVAAPEAEEQKLWDEMMAIHDEVMPAMGDIFKYSKGLKTYLDSTEVDAALEAEIEAILEQLDKADEGMMDWMAELKQPGELKKTLSEKEVLDYLKKESEKIKVVKTQMEESIEEGEKMLKKLTPVDVSQ